MVASGLFPIKPQRLVVLESLRSHLPPIAATVEQGEDLVGNGNDQSDEQYGQPQYRPKQNSVNLFHDSVLSKIPISQSTNRFAN